MGSSSGNVWEAATGVVSGSGVRGVGSSSSGGGCRTPKVQSVPSKITEGMLESSSPERKQPSARLLFWCPPPPPPPSAFSRCFNRDAERASAKWQVSPAAYLQRP